MLQGSADDFFLDELLKSPDKCQGAMQEAKSNLDRALDQLKVLFHFCFNFFQKPKLKQHNQSFIYIFLQMCIGYQTSSVAKIAKTTRTC